MYIFVQDADMIIDNTATGTTLAANRLRIVDELLQSSTHLCVNRAVLTNPAQMEIVNSVILLLKGAIHAKNKVFVEFNVTKELLEDVVAFLPAMKKPTINSLYGGEGFAVKAVVSRSEITTLLPKIRQHGGTDIIVLELKSVVP
jgi:ATP phosphoribosyltransferase